MNMHLQVRKQAEAFLDRGLTSVEAGVSLGGLGDIWTES